MKRNAAIAALTLCLVALGCYHATIETGLAPNNQVIKQKWASSWIFGLVPPKTVEAAAKCPGGVSKVETQLSFLNQLVGAVTFGIYTPMAIEVTCSDKHAMNESGSGFDELLVAANATPEEIREAYAQAARLAYQRQAAVYVRFAEADSAESGS